MLTKALAKNDITCNPDKEACAETTGQYYIYNIFFKTVPFGVVALKCARRSIRSFFRSLSVNFKNLNACLNR